MALKYTEEQLNSLDRETLTRLFLSQQEQLENIDHTLQLVLEQMADLKRHRFGRSTEKHETEDQISFMEVDGKIVFFNESEAVAAEENAQDEPENVSHTKPKKKPGKREEDLDGIPAVVVEHSMTDQELEDYLAKNVFSGMAGSTLEPDKADMDGFAAFLNHYVKGLAVEKAACENV